MLMKHQCVYLSKLAELKGVYNSKEMHSIVPPSADQKIKIPLDEFMAAMDLEPMRLSWLLGNKNCIAGGATLNWIIKENKNEDIDFFCQDTNTIQSFMNLVIQFGFKVSNSSGYAITLFNEETKLIIQIVSKYVGPPEDIIDDFDINVCKFAIDNNFIYTTRQAICDLLTLNITRGKIESVAFKDRVLKYNKKGYFICNEIKKSIDIKPPSFIKSILNTEKW